MGFREELGVRKRNYQGWLVQFVWAGVKAVSQTLVRQLPRMEGHSGLWSEMQTGLQQYIYIGEWRGAMQLYK